jgi:hypothetical protein
LRQIVVGCGSHPQDPDCLCDVIVRHRTPINPRLSDGWLVERICDVAGLEQPLAGQDLVRFLDLWTYLHDYANRADAKASSTSFAVKVEEWRMYARRRFLEGATTSEVRAEILDRYGVTLSASNASHMRRRMLERAA